ncbi:MAG: radical SAM protein [Candidatus Zixiibacteriota bacterium]
MKKLSSSEIYEIGVWLFESMNNCRLCPMDCGVNRLDGELGCCHSTSQLRVASHNLHFGEEPPLSGGGGSGTIFLSNCSLSCLYCQNYPISQFGTGQDISTDQMAQMMLKLQKRGAENINFVTPSHMLPMILIALAEAKKDGLLIPLVYNCSGYEKVEIIRHLDGIIDIFLPDMRYGDDAYARKYSGCKNYVETNRAAIKEMYRQVGNLVCDKRGIAVSGMIVRHLVLPGRISGSKEILKFLAEKISPDIYISLMSQYFPAHLGMKDCLINRRITNEEFDEVVEAFDEYGLKNGFTQQLDYEEVY